MTPRPRTLLGAFTAVAVATGMGSAAPALALGTGASDTQRPSSPSPLIVTDSTKAMIALTWPPAQDDTGVAGYVVRRGRTAATRVTRESATFRGLRCGSAYTFTVQARDRAGNLSPRSTLTASTAPCWLPRAAVRPGRAQVFLSPRGDDSTCVRYTSGTRSRQPRACLTFERAYRLAQPGDIVEMGGGTYGPDQRILRDPAKNYPGDARHVLFRAKAGETPRLRGTFGRGGLSIRGAEHLTVTGLAGIADVGITPFDYCDNSTLSRDVVIVGNRFKTMHLRSPDGVIIRGNIIGNYSYQEENSGSPKIGNSLCSPGVPSPVARNVVIEDNVWQNINRDGSDTHPECLTFESSQGVIIRRNAMKDCPGFAIFASGSNGSVPTDVVVENNFLGCGDNGRPKTRCAYPINMRPDFTLANWTIRFNSLEGSVLLQDGAAELDYVNVRIYGNVGFRPTACPAGVSFAFNVWESPSHCGGSDIAAGHRWMNLPVGNFHLHGGVQLADNRVPATFCASAGCPADDIDRELRPRAASGARDAGGDERSR